MLADHGIDGEPLEWEPALPAISRDAWPGIDPDAIEPETLAAALAGTASVGDIASAHNATIEQIRTLARSHSWKREPCAARVERNIPEEVLRQKLVDEHLTSRQVAEHFGVDRKTVQARAKKYGISLKRGRWGTWTIDAEWLRNQYEARGRTLPDIAAEIGCTPTHLGRVAHEVGIVVRPRGGASHASAVTPDTDLPDLLQKALRGQGGRQRLERFMFIVESGSLMDASRKLGVTQSTLTTQLKELEGEVGGQLLVRNQQPRPRSGPDFAGR